LGLPPIRLARKNDHVSGLQFSKNTFLVECLLPRIKSYVFSFFRKAIKIFEKANITLDKLPYIKKANTYFDNTFSFQTSNNKKNTANKL